MTQSKSSLLREIYSNIVEASPDMDRDDACQQAADEYNEFRGSASRVEAHDVESAVAEGEKK